jgi:putative tRNA adenosine deaminase-associated protein
VPQYFAATLAESGGRWTGREEEVGDYADLDHLVESMRDYGDGGRVLLFVEEDDEYLAILRVDGDLDPRAFISDDRAVRTSAVAALVMEDLAAETVVDEDEEEGTRPDPIPVGDLDLVADFGVDADGLIGLCHTEGMLPADMITAICEKAGCADVLEDLRGG